MEKSSFRKIIISQGQFHILSAFLRQMRGEMAFYIAIRYRKQGPAHYRERFPCAKIGQIDRTK